MIKIICGILWFALVVTDIIILIKTIKEHKQELDTFVTINITSMVFIFFPIVIKNFSKDSIPIILFGLLMYLITLIAMLIKIKEINVSRINREKIKREENWK